MSPKPKPEAGKLPAIAACPSCGRRPSERVALHWSPHFEGPGTLACRDVTHDRADLGPTLEEGLQRLRVLLAKRSPEAEDPVSAEVARLLALAVADLGGGA